MKLLRGKRVGPRNPVARGFSLGRRTPGRKSPSRASAHAGRPLRRPQPPKTHLSLVLRTLQPVWKCQRDGLKAGSRQVAGSVPRARFRLLAFLAVARLQTVVSRDPSGSHRLHPESRNRARPGFSRPTVALPRSGRTGQGPESPGRIRWGPEAGSE